MKHKDLMERTLVSVNGFLLSVHNAAPDKPELVLGLGGVNPEYHNLIWAAALLYRTAGETRQYLESLIEYLEENGLDEAVGSVTQIQATLNTAMKFAIEGLPKKMQDDKKSG
jgi:hypothetical protein